MEAPKRASCTASLPRPNCCSVGSDYFSRLTRRLRHRNCRRKIEDQSELISLRMRRQQFSTGRQYEFYRDTTSVTAASTRVNFSHDQRKNVAVTVQKLDVYAILSVNLRRPPLGGRKCYRPKPSSSFVCASSGASGSLCSGLWARWPV